MTSLDGLTTFIDRLPTVISTLGKIFDISGTAGASVGVSQGGKPIWSANFGYRDVENKVPPDEDTVYIIASLTKAISASAVGLLVDDGHFEFGTPLIKMIPEIKFHDSSINDKVTMTDMLSHRIGFTGDVSLWSQGGNDCHIPKDQILPVISWLRPIKAFRDGYLYSNWGYCIIPELTERFARQGFGDFLAERLFEPLGMKSSFVKAGTKVPKNNAGAYMPMDEKPLDEKRFYRIPFPKSDDSTIISGAGGVRSSVNDLLLFYNALLAARKNEELPPEKRKQTVIRRASELLGDHALLSQKSLRARTYGLGLAKIQLPGSMGSIGFNGGLVKEMPIIGKNSPSTIVLYHQGCCPGYSTSAILLPDDDIVIVVLTNSLAYNDAADWAGQAILETVLGEPKLGEPKTDFVELAAESKNNSLKQFTDLEAYINSTRKNCPPSKPLKAFTGVYYNSMHNFFLHVFEMDGSLYFNFQGESWDNYPLTPYAENEFSWNLSRDEQGRRGRWPISSPEYFILKFIPDSADDIVSIRWRMDPNVPGGEIFSKD